MLSSSGKDLLSNAAPVALKLRSGSTFNQVDLLSGHLKYKLTTMSQHKSLDDTFSFRVSIKSEGKIISPIEVIKICTNYRYVIKFQHRDN